MSTAFWQQVFAAGPGTSFFAIPGTALFLRVQVDEEFPEDGPEEAWVSRRGDVDPAELEGPQALDQRHLYFRGDEITLKEPMGMSGVQWTPRHVIWGTTMEDGPAPVVVATTSRDEWLDQALAAMVAELG